VCAMADKEDCISFQSRQTRMANFTVNVCYPNWLKIASIVFYLVSYFSRTECLLTRQSWLKTRFSQLQWLPRKRRMATELSGPQPSWLSYLWSYASTLQVISTQAKCHRRAEESLAVHMWRSATELYQQGHTEHRQKTLSLCESWGRTPWTRLEINCFHRVLNWQQAMFSSDFNTSITIKIVIFIVNVLHDSVVA